MGMGRALSNHMQWLMGSMHGKTERGLEMRLEERLDPVMKKRTYYSKEDELHYVLPLEHLSRRVA